LAKKSAKRKYAPSYENPWVTTWPRIARYLSVSVATVKRYHYKYGMPVRHGPVVSALKHELDEWWDRWLESVDRRRRGEI
jgi:hypothetical protein